MALGNSLLPPGDPAQPPLTCPHGTFGQFERRMAVQPGTQQLAGKLLQTCRRRGLPSQLAQSMTQHVLEPREGHLANGIQSEGVAVSRQLPVEKRQFGKQRIGFGKVGSSLRETLLRRGKAFGKNGHYLVTHEIARQGGIGIALIIDPFELRSAGIGLDFMARHVEQGAQDTQTSQSAIGRNCRRPGHTSATQQVEQQCFCLVTLMMTEQQRIGCEVGKDLITRHSCGRLKAKTAFAVDFDGPYVASHTQACAVSDAEIRPAPGIRRKAVVHVNGAQPFGQAELDQNMKEND